VTFAYFIIDIDFFPAINVPTSTNNNSSEKDKQAWRRKFRKARRENMEHTTPLAHLKKYLMIFLIGGVGYASMEKLFRGFTHWSMFFAGGIVLVILYYVNSKNENAPLWQKCLVGALIITTVELVIGCVVNLWLGWNVWDYSAYPFNFMGQICLAFTVLWFFLCIPLSYFTRYLHLRRFRLRQ